MKKISFSAKILIFSVLCLIFLGIIIIASVSTIASQEKFNTTTHYLVRQLESLAVGLFLAFIAYIMPLKFYKKWSLPLLIGAIILSVLVFIPKIGFSSGGARRWISIGPMFFQPGELLKLAFIIFVSGWLGKIPTKYQKNKRKKRDFFTGLGICLGFFALTCIILLTQPDASTLVIIFFVSVAMYFLAGTPLWHTLLLVITGISGVWTMIKFAPYRSNRLAVFLDPNLDPMGLGYQMKQIFIAIGSGGILGLGFGMSRQKLGFLPEPMGDAIFAVFAEESGFIGAILMVILFMLFAWAGLTIAKKVSDKSFSLLAAGITIWISFQAFINMASMLRVSPLVGIPLPLVSYGGSHLVVELAAIGILLNIANNKS